MPSWQRRTDRAPRSPPPSPEAPTCRYARPAGAGCRAVAAVRESGGRRAHAEDPMRRGRAFTFSLCRAHRGGGLLACIDRDEGAVLGADIIGRRPDDLVVEPLLD